MKWHLTSSAKKRQISVVIGVLAALLVISTSAFQFHLEPVGVPQVRGIVHQAQESGNSEDEPAPITVCTIQAVSQGVQLQVTYEPIVWEFAEIDLPELKLEIPSKVYTTSWEYFKVLFRDIISPNAP